MRLVKDFADVDSLDSYEERIHMIRQLTGRVDEAPIRAMPTHGPSQKSILASDDQPQSPTAASPMGSVSESARFENRA